MEMSDDVFASPDTTRSRRVNYPQSEETCDDLYACSDILTDLGSPDCGPENQGSTPSESGGVKQGVRRSTLAVVGQGLLSVLLLTTLIRLRSYNYYKDISQRENQMIQSVSLFKTNYTDERVTERERNQLQGERDQLHRERHQLHRERPVTQRERPVTQRERPVTQRETSYTERETSYMERETSYTERETSYRERKTSYRQRKTSYTER
ncbi:unnamed protein product [Coregonus sp. 'balchen']|nr:unnamed protein product [Coregonus sp. 'balchen']